MGKEKQKKDKKKGKKKMSPIINILIAFSIMCCCLIGSGVMITAIAFLFF